MTSRTAKPCLLQLLPIGNTANTTVVRGFLHDVAQNIQLPAMRGLDYVL